MHIIFLVFHTLSLFKCDVHGAVIKKERRTTALHAAGVTSVTWRTNDTMISMNAGNTKAVFQSSDTLWGRRDVCFERIAGKKFASSFTTGRRKLNLLPLHDQDKSYFLMDWACGQGRSQTHRKQKGSVTLGIIELDGLQILDISIHVCF